MVPTTFEQRRRELACPRCGYSLRGLRGQVVTCPECGTSCDVTRLVMNAWKGPWQRAPGFTRILVPVTWAVGGALAAFVAFVWTDDWRSLATAGGLVFAGWTVALWRLRSLMPNGAAVWLSLLAHVLFVVYAGGFFYVGAAAISAVVDGFTVAALVRLALALPVIALLLVARRLERFIAEQCIRRHLMIEAQVEAAGGDGGAGAQVEDTA